MNGSRRSSNLGSVPGTNDLVRNKQDKSCIIATNNSLPLKRVNKAKIRSQVHQAFSNEPARPARICVREKEG